MVTCVNSLRWSALIAVPDQTEQALEPAPSFVAIQPTNAAPPTTTQIAITMFTTFFRMPVNSSPKRKPRPAAANAIVPTAIGVDPLNQPATPQSGPSHGAELSLTDCAAAAPA